MYRLFMILVTVALAVYALVPSVENTIRRLRAPRMRQETVMVTANGNI